MYLPFGPFTQYFYNASKQLKEWCLVETIKTSKYLSNLFSAYRRYSTDIFPSRLSSALYHYLVNDCYNYYLGKFNVENMNLMNVNFMKMSVNSKQFLRVKFASGESSYIVTTPEKAVFDVLQEVCEKKTLDIDCHRLWNAKAGMQLELDKKVSELTVSEVYCRPMDGEKLKKQMTNNQKDLEHLESILARHQAHLEKLMKALDDCPSEAKAEREKEIKHFRKLISIMDNERTRLKKVLSYAVLCAKTSRRGAVEVAATTGSSQDKSASSTPPATPSSNTCNNTTHEAAVPI
eukprot:Nk52_evm92s2118 gene=Nk52_evmTU92s2118